MKNKKNSFLGRLRRNLKNHLLPHKGNDHTPYLLRHRVLFGYSLLIIALKVLLITTSIALPADSLYSSAITSKNIISLTNDARKNLNLKVLNENPKLDQSAQLKAEDLLAHQYFAHVSPSGLTPWSWFVKAGYSYRYAGENLAVYFSTSEDTMAGWLASSTHRANIVDPRYTEIGVGVASGTYHGFPAIFVVQHFGYPASTNTLSKKIISTSLPETSTNKNVLAATDTNNESAANVQDLYAFGGANHEKLFGLIDVSGLNDGVRQFYIASIVLLSGILLITLFARFNWSRTPLTAHALAVMIIALVFTVV